MRPSPVVVLVVSPPWRQGQRLALLPPGVGAEAGVVGVAEGGTCRAEGGKLRARPERQPQSQSVPALAQPALLASP